MKRPYRLRSILFVLLSEFKLTYAPTIETEKGMTYNFNDELIWKKRSSL